MGMYTELVLKCRIVDRVPDAVEEVLQHMFNGKEMARAWPAELSADRMPCIGSCSSFYHTPFALSKYSNEGTNPSGKGGYIFSRSDLKNYGGEIEQFLDWLRPYMEDDPGSCIGWQWYEEDEVPTLIFR